MKKIGLIFPHQLFKNNPLLKIVDTVYLIEDSLFFGDKHNHLSFHKMKIAFHRATMKSYEDFLKEKNISVEYISYKKEITIRDIAKKLQRHQIFVIDPTDYLLEKRIRESFNSPTFVENPLFINTKEENQKFIKTQSKLLMYNFYVHQRKKLNILIDSKGKPTGGKWSFDEDNRKKIPQKEYKNIPEKIESRTNDYTEEAKKYTEKNFKNNPGNLETFIYPTNHQEAEKWFNDFLSKRFEKFGPYEDAILEDYSILYHSLLSPLLNIGLLEPKYIVEKALLYAHKHNIPINSIEGFIRQIIGWREYMRLVYELHGTQMRKQNIWKHKNKLPLSFYTGETGLVPVDQTIQKINNLAYCHHIERLMVLGNSMFLLEIEPDEVYKWFMEMFIDAYDWVMVPNIYAMSQNSVGDLITTKPYISGSNYILKMSDFKKDTWCDVWDSMYWVFVSKHHTTLAKNFRMNIIAKKAQDMDNQKLESHKKILRDFKKHIL